MINDTIITTAMDLAVIAHNGQVNKHDGEPYLLHPLRVARLVQARAPEMIFAHAIAVALLHDSIEDSDGRITQEVITMAFAAADLSMAGKVIGSNVDCLTKTRGENNRDYYIRVRDFSEIARLVKVCDITDNFRRNHAITDEATRLRMAQKYSLGLDILTEGA